MQPTNTLVADPPWEFDDKMPGPKRGAVKHYRVMSVDDICALALPPLADDCRLFLWRVASQVEEAYRVVRAWGFSPKSEIVWVKCKPENLPKLTIGMGWQVRNAHEAVIIATRGRPLRLSRAVPSVIFAPRRKHSEKPDEFYQQVDRLSPGPIVELFARRQWPGWLCLGGEMAVPTEHEVRR